MEKQLTLLNKIERYGGMLVILLLLGRILIGTDLNVVLRISLTLFSIFYMWFGFLIFNRVVIGDLIHAGRRKVVNPFRIGSSILMGFCYSYCIISIVFSFFFLRGMQFMLSLSTLLLVAGTVFLVIYNWINKNETTYLRQYYLRSAILVVILISLLLTPLEARLKVLYGDHPDFVEAYINYHNNPGNEQFVEPLKEARSQFR